MDTRVAARLLAFVALCAFVPTAVGQDLLERCGFCCQEPAGPNDVDPALLGVQTRDDVTRDVCNHANLSPADLGVCIQAAGDQATCTAWCNDHASQLALIVFPPVVHISTQTLLARCIRCCQEPAGSADTSNVLGVQTRDDVTQDVCNHANLSPADLDVCIQDAAGPATCTAWCNAHAPQLAGIPFACGAVCDEPHFTGLDGVHYDFQGRANTVFALISDVSVAVNSRFISFDQDNKYMYLGETCLRVCNETVRLFPNGTVLYNDEPVKPEIGFVSPQLRGRWMGAPVTQAHHISVNQHSSYAHMWVGTIGGWDIRFGMLGTHVNIEQVDLEKWYSGSPHGVYGHTYKYRANKNARCNTKNEGACEVEGDWHEYIVPGNDVCYPTWMHSKFTCDP